MSQIYLKVYIVYKSGRDNYFLLLSVKISKTCQSIITNSVQLYSEICNLHVNEVYKHGKVLTRGSIHTLERKWVIRFHIA